MLFCQSTATCPWGNNDTVFLPDRPTVYSLLFDKLQVACSFNDNRNQRTLHTPTVVYPYVNWINRTP